MLIEFLGLPGAGKSTLIRALVPALRAQGMSARRADKLAGLPSVERNAPRYLERGADRTTLYRITRFRREHRGLMKHIEHKLALGQADEFLFSLTAGLYQACREYGDTIGAALLDEGFVHRGVSAHLDRDDALFERYVAMIPAPDLLVHLCPPVDTAFERAVSRRAHKGEAEKVISKLGGLPVFERRDALIRLGTAGIRARGEAVVEVDSRRPLNDCVAELCAAVAAQAQPWAGAAE